MNKNQINAPRLGRSASLGGLAALLLALGGCVTCPDGSVGNVCYAPNQGRYNSGYYPPPQPHYGAGYYVPPPTYYPPRYYRQPYYPY